METQSPFSLLDRVSGTASQLLSKLAPPDWLVHEMQRRLVLLLNHVVMQEPEAQARLVRQKGRVMLAQWRAFTLRLQITPAGMFDLAESAQTPDLTITIDEPSPWIVARTAMQGGKPAVRIEGDVQLAAEVNWLADHLRWDVEEDLARIMGDVPAHTLAQGARSIAAALRAFVGRVEAKVSGRAPGHADAQGHENEGSEGQRP